MVGEIISEWWATSSGISSLDVQAVRGVPATLGIQPLILVTRPGAMPRLFAAVLILSSTPAIAQDKPAATEAGAAIYDDYCSRCHGDGLRNTSGGVTFDLRRLQPNEHERFVNSVLNGKKQMPPWRGVLDSEQIEQVWAYIRATVDRQP